MQLPDVVHTAYTGTNRSQLSDNSTTTVCDSSLVLAGPPTVSRRRVIAVGIAGLTWLLFPCRNVLGAWDTLGERLSREVEEMAADAVLKGVPKLARMTLDQAFTEGIKNPVLAGLSGASDQERAQLTSALGQVQGLLGDVTEDWAGRILRGGNIVDTLKQSVDARTRLEQPTFQYPYSPTYAFSVGTPTPSTSQSAIEMLENLRLGKFPIDPAKLSLNWDVFDFQANSDFDRLHITGSVKAERFFDSSFNIVSPNWQAKAGLEWRHFQNGALMMLKADISGNFNNGSSGDVWTALLTVEFRLP